MLIWSTFQHFLSVILPQVLRVPHLICVGQRSKLTEGVERLLQNSPRVNTFPLLTSLMDEVRCVRGRVRRAYARTGGGD